MSQESYVPQGFHHVNAYIVATNARAVIDFAKVVFNAEEKLCMKTPDGGVAHAEFRIGDSVVEIADGNETWPASPASLHVYVPNTDETYGKAVAAGAIILAEPADQFYGERSASVQDPTGNYWHIATKVEDVSAEEMQRRAEQWQQSQQLA